MAGTRKYIRIPHKDLPDLLYLKGTAGEDGKNVYFLRYRVSNEAGTSFSKWSQEFEVPSGISASKFLVSPTSPPDVEESYKVKGSADTASGILDASWDTKTLIEQKILFQNKFHIYIRTHTNNAPDQWTFAQEVLATSFKTKLPASVSQTKCDIAVLVPTYRGLDAEPGLGSYSPIDLYPESVVWYHED